MAIKTNFIFSEIIKNLPRNNYSREFSMFYIAGFFLNIKVKVTFLLLSQVKQILACSLVSSSAHVYPKIGINQSVMPRYTTYAVSSLFHRNKFQIVNHWLKYIYSN